jgi:hypothetical protein
MIPAFQAIILITLLFGFTIGLFAYLEGPRCKKWRLVSARTCDGDIVVLTVDLGNGEHRKFLGIGNRWDEEFPIAKNKYELLSCSRRENIVLNEFKETAKFLEMI